MNLVINRRQPRPLRELVMKNHCATLAIPAGIPAELTNLHLPETAIRVMF